MYTADAMQAALGFAVKQTATIEREVYKTQYPEIQYRGLVFVDTSANEWTKSVTHYASDMYGQARWVNGNADDIPLAGTERSEHESLVHTAGVGYGWGYEEIHQAQMLGQKLPAEEAEAARRAFEEMVDRVVLYGDAAKGFKGLINHSDVVTANAATGDWDNATADQILADVNKLLIGIGTATRHVAVANTLLMSEEKFADLATRRLPDSDTTILKFLRESNVYTAKTNQPLNFRTIRGLETAGVGGTERMVAYRNDRTVLKLHMPMPFRFMPLFQPTPMNFVVPGLFRMGGLDVRLTKEIRYADGI